jgi:HK97 family phage major capsid protein
MTTIQHYQPTVHAATQARRDQAQADLEQILATAEISKRSLYASEARKFESLSAEIKALDVELAELGEAGDRLAKANKAAADHERAAHAYVRREARTYGPESRDANGDRYGFVLDVLAARKGDSEAATRLDRHRQEVGFEERAAGRSTSTYTSDFQMPTYLLEEYVPYFRASTPTWNRTRTQDLPPGYASVSIPKITTGTLTAPQTADNAGIASQDVVTSTISAPALTIAGQTDYSVQMRDMTPIDFDQVMLQDLALDIGAKKDRTILDGSGSNGQVTGLLNLTNAQAITYTEATPTAYGLITAVQKAVNYVRTSRFAPPDSIVMASRRWAYFAQTVDDSHRPVVQPETTGLNVFGVSNAVSDDPLAPVGTIAGLPVFVDPLLDTIAGTGQDTIIVGRLDDYWTFESPVHLRIVDSVLSGTLGLRAQSWLYVAAASRFDKSIALIKGTGTAQPSGYGS